MNTIPSLIVTADGFVLRPELMVRANEKAAKLIRHHQPHAIRVRLHLAREVPHTDAPRFAVRATAEHAGPDHVVHAFGFEPDAAVNAAFSKLERAFRETAGIRKHARHLAD